MNKSSEYLNFACTRHKAHRHWHWDRHNSILPVHERSPFQLAFMYNDNQVFLTINSPVPEFQRRKSPPANHQINQPFNPPPHRRRLDHLNTQPTKHKTPPTPSRGYAILQLRSIVASPKETHTSHLPAKEHIHTPLQALDRPPQRRNLLRIRSSAYHKRSAGSGDLSQDLVCPT